MHLRDDRSWLRKGLLFLSGLGAASFAACMDAHADDIDVGRELSRTHCTRCHIVADFNTVSIGSTPSFQMMVNAERDYLVAFLSFYALRPHPAFVRVEGIEPLNDLPSPIAEIHLTLDDVDDIAAFAGTLAED